MWQGAADRLEVSVDTATCVEVDDQRFHPLGKFGGVRKLTDFRCKLAEGHPRVIGIQNCPNNPTGIGFIDQRKKFFVPKQALLIAESNANQFFEHGAMAESRRVRIDKEK